MSKRTASSNLDGSEQVVRVGERAYRVRTQVVVEEVDGDESRPGGEVRQEADGCFEMMLSEENGTSIDQSEQAVLATCWPAMRHALSQHLHSVSKKKAEKAVARDGGQAVEDPTAYRVEGEVGRFAFPCHHVVVDDRVVLDTSRQVFPALTGKEWYRTVGFKELAIVRGALDSSYRHTTQMLNRFRHQPEATPLRTLQDAVEGEGLAAAAAQDTEARRVVRAAGLSAETLTPEQDCTACSPQHLAPELVDAALREIAPDPRTLEAMRANPVGYESPEVTVSVSIDDVLAKKQREHRCGKGRTIPVESSDSRTCRTTAAKGQKKCVHTTVAHVQSRAGERIFCSPGVVSTCLLVMAFLVANQMLGLNWIFFVDGQRTLHEALLRLFAWQGTLQLILDWHHIDKKCQETLSLALNNRHVRNQVLQEVLALLWYGNVDAATAYLRRVDTKHVKCAEALERLVGYFERHRGCIPCYAARKQLGLRNSSNRGEKANDQVVSARQKHNGMSWSQPGSSALSTLRALVCNNQHRQWFETNTVDFPQAA